MVLAISFFTYWFIKKSSVGIVQDSVALQVINKLPQPIDFYVINLNDPEAGKDARDACSNERRVALGVARWGIRTHRVSFPGELVRMIQTEPTRRSRNRDQDAQVGVSTE